MTPDEMAAKTEPAERQSAGAAVDNLLEEQLPLHRQSGNLVAYQTRNLIAHYWRLEQTTPGLHSICQRPIKIQRILAPPLVQKQTSKIASLNEKLGPKGLRSAASLAGWPFMRSTAS